MLDALGFHWPSAGEGANILLFLIFLALCRISDTLDRLRQGIEWRASLDGRRD